MRHHLLSISQAVDLCAEHGVTICRQSVRRWAVRDRIGRKIGARWFFTSDEIMRRIAARRPVGDRA
jgi:hypothetical protein